MSLQTPLTIGSLPRKLCVKAKVGKAAQTLARHRPLQRSECSTLSADSVDVKPAGKPDAGNRHVRLCVQRRLACSAGDKPAGVKVRSPVVWIAGWRETKTLKPIDKVSFGEITSRRAVTKVNANVASKVSGTKGRARNRRGEGSMGRRNLTNTAPSPWRGGSDSTVARTCRATGEALLVPVRNHRRRVDRITGSTGKSVDGERVADGSV